MKQNMKRLSLVCMFVTAMTLGAVELKVDRTGQTTEERTFTEDYLHVGESLIMKGTAEDLFFAGKDLSFTGKTVYSLLGAGEILNIEGEVGNDLVVIGKRVLITGHIHGNVLAAAEDLLIDKNAVIDGSLFTGAARVRLAGKLGGDIYAAAGRVELSGSIAGDSVFGARMISLADGSEIGGNLLYYSKYKISEKEAQMVKGNVRYEARDFGHKEKDGFKSGKLVFLVIFKIIAFISLLIAGLLILLIPAASGIRAGDVKTFRSYLLFGLIPFFAYPAVTVLSFVMGITIPLGVLLLLAAFPFLFITQIIGITLAGSYIWNAAKWKEVNRFVYFMFGLVVFGVLSLVPVVGLLALIIVSAAGWGYLVKTMAS